MLQTDLCPSDPDLAGSDNDSHFAQVLEIPWTFCLQILDDTSLWNISIQCYPKTTRGLHQYHLPPILWPLPKKAGISATFHCLLWPLPPGHTHIRHSDDIRYTSTMSRKCPFFDVATFQAFSLYGRFFWSFIDPINLWPHHIPPAWIVHHCNGQIRCFRHRGHLSV